MRSILPVACFVLSALVCAAQTAFLRQHLE